MTSLRQKLSAYHDDFLARERAQGEIDNILQIAGNNQLTRNQQSQINQHQATVDGVTQSLGNKSRRLLAFFRNVADNITATLKATGAGIITIFTMVAAAVVTKARAIKHMIDFPGPEFAPQPS